MIIVTWNRPDYVERALCALKACGGPPLDIIVVDGAYEDDRTRQIAAASDVTYVRYPPGAGHMTRARNAGLMHARGEVIAFLDDDSWVRVGWAAELMQAYDHLEIAAAVGRTCNGIAGEDTAGIDQIGRLLPDGRLTGNFAADSGQIVDVDHGIGANMSFRKDVIAALGGFRDDFRGTGGVREDTDMFLRVRTLKGRAIFVPRAVVDHVGAPHARGQRFDWRYNFWSRYNHVLLLSRNFGYRSRIIWRWAVREVGTRDDVPGSAFERVARVGLRVGAVALGLGASLVKARPGPTHPSRRDKRAHAISRALGATSARTLAGD